MNKELSQIIKHWNYISPIVGAAKTKKQYKTLLKQWEDLVDLIGDNENHKLTGLLDVVSYFIEDYKRRNDLIKNKVTGIDVLKFLIEARDLRQADLKDLGSQGVVSELLSGKRQLSFIKGDFKKMSPDPYFARGKIIKDDFKIIKANFKK